MMHKSVYEYLDKVLRNITRVDALFGGKVVILGGDFRQIPTVIQKGSRALVCEASLKRAYFWPVMKQVELNRRSTCGCRAWQVSTLFSVLLALGHLQHIITVICINLDFCSCQLLILRESTVSQKPLADMRPCMSIPGDLMQAKRQKKPGKPVSNC